MIRSSADAQERAEAELEQAIDSVLAASFPASDPPQWDSLATRSRAQSHQKNQDREPERERASAATSPTPWVTMSSQ